MTARTVQILGVAFGETPATVIATLDGNTIFNGTVTTRNEPIPTSNWTQLMNEWTPLFTFEIPMDFEGTIPMTCETSGSPVVFGTIAANYSNVWVYGNVEANIPGYAESSGPDGYAVIHSHDPRINTTLNGQPFTPERGASATGTWWWIIAESNVLGYDLHITSAGNIGNA